MTVPVPGGGQTTVTTTTSVGFSSISTSTRYMGMIEESGYKKSRNSLFILFDYIASTSPTFYFVHNVISIWRIIQIIGPSLAVQYPGFWKDGTLKSVFDIVSIIFHIIPGFARKECAVYILFVYIGVFFLVFVGVGAAAYVLSLVSKLPVMASTALTLFFSTIGYIFHPVAIEMAGELIGLMIMGHYPIEPVSIVAIVLTFIVFLGFIWLYSNMYAVSITFKPDSLMSAIPVVETTIVATNALITLITAIASHLEKIPCITLTAFAIVLYAYSIFAVFDKGGLVNFIHVKCVAASNLTGALILVLVIIFEIAQIKADEIIMVVFIFVWFICFFVFSVVLDKRLIKIIRVLDSIEEDNNNFVFFKSPRLISDYIVNGFRMSHPVCLSYSIFRLAVEMWPKHVEIWLLFAKFTAIYPEETQQMVYISMGMVQNKLKGALAKHAMQQIQSTMKQRETNLVSELKSKLDKVGKQVQSTKHKVRYIWDLVLQGNIKELEHVISNAHHSIDLCEAEFNHFLRQFPNNRFVARSYCRFLRDVVADHAGHKVWAQNVALLQRGVNVKSDQAHDLGIHAFPILPRQTETQLQSTQTTTMGMTDDTLTQDIDVDDESAAIDAELRVSVRESINNLSIPAFRLARIMRIMTILILFIAPVIALTIYIPIFINEIAEPLTFLYDISIIRTRTFQAVANSFHYVAENINLMYNMTTPISNPDFYDGTVVFPIKSDLDLLDQSIEDPPVHFGGTFDSKNQTDYILQRMTEILPQFSIMSNFKKGNEKMEAVRDLIFNKKINFTFLSNPTFLSGYSLDTTDDSLIQIKKIHAMVSAREAIAEYVVLLRQLIDENYTIKEDIMTTKYMTIPVNNIRILVDDLSDALTIIREYIIQHGHEVVGNIETAMIAIIIVVVILYTVFYIVISKMAMKEKLMIYRCLTSLPKNVVSRVADSFKILKKEEDEEIRTSYTRDEELNKQEENMLKVFSTSSDTSKSSSTDEIFWAIFTILVAALHVATTVVLCNFISSTCKHMMESSPHIDFIMSSYAFDLATVLLINMLPSSFHPYVSYHISGFNTNTILSVIPEWQEKSTTSYQAVRYGNDELEAVPFASLGIDISDGSSESECTEDIPVNNHDIYRCWTPDLLTSFIQMEVNALVHRFNTSNPHIIYGGDNLYLTHIWHIHQVHIFNQYFAPMFNEIIPMVLNSMHREVPQINGISFALLVIAVIIEIMFIVTINRSEERQKFAMRLLLHCPGNVIVSNSHITAILGGNFSAKHVDSTTRDSEFYDILVKDMPDSVVICDSLGAITSMNKATDRVYGINEEDYIGKKIDELGKRFGDSENPFPSYLSSADHSNFEKKLFFTKPGECSQIHVELIVSYMQESLIVTTRDITQTVMYNKLISDEKLKSDRLLSSILPAKLVPRVQAGEKNISFAVQTATILFMDIVSFTPWCGSLPAATVMKTLNMLFKEFDALVAIHPTITKIKCIGDCYMAAGGIFAEMNQPAQHSKEVVEFGLEAIESLEKIDVEIEQDLKIRVGINTGGPIVAGVLGTEKPTFEILGPTINMAQQMEHHGVPMKVHVSRAVYELIYGGNFDVKERGEIEIKGGHVVTYIVNRARDPSPTSK